MSKASNGSAAAWVLGAVVVLALLAKSNAKPAPAASNSGK